MRSLDIQLSDSGAWLDVPSDTKIKMTFYNPLFPDNWNRRDRSGPVRLPKSPVNNKHLSWRGEIGIITDNPALSCRVYQDNVLLFKGTLRVTDVGSYYNCHLLTTFGEWDYKTLDKSIQSYAYDSGTPFTTPDADIIANTYPDVPFAFPAFYAFNFVDYRSGDIPNEQNVYKHTYYGMTPGSTNSTFVSPYVMYVIDKIMEEEGYQKPGGDFMADTELQTLVMLSNAHRPEDLTGWEFDAAKHLPDLRVSEFFDSLRAMFNVGVFFNKDGSAPLIKKNNVIINGAIVNDWTSKTPLDYVKQFDKTVGKVKIGYAKEYYDLWEKNEVPPQFRGTWQELADYQVNSLLLNSTYLILAENTYWSNADGNGKEAKDYNCLQVNPDEYTRLPDVADVASLPALTFPDDAGKICLVTNEGWFYKVIYNGPTSSLVWSKMAWDNWPYQSQDNDVITEIESKIGIPVMDRIGGEISPGDERYYFPCLKNIRAITDLYENDDNTQHMSMMAFNRGSRLHGAGIGYEVLFSSDEYDYNYNVIGNYSLRWNGERGLLAQNWGNSLDYIQNGQPYIFRPLLTLTDFRNFEMYQKTYIHGLEGFVKQMDVEFPLVNPVKIEFVS